ncbi:hypothetical protein IJ556_07895 [bacterium]|nr:hypothetical protein [bacterium]MBR2274197.1 hypothetical protein [Alphaproteobacteria bacterium]
MERSGLEVILREWWHYNLPNGRNDRYLMVDLRAFFC